MLYRLNYIHCLKFINIFVSISTYIVAYVCVFYVYKSSWKKKNKKKQGQIFCHLETCR